MVARLVTVTFALPPPLSLTSQVNVLPFSFLASLGQVADVICVVEFESEELSMPCSALLASTVSLPQPAVASSPKTTARSESLRMVVEPAAKTDAEQGCEPVSVAANDALEACTTLTRMPAPLPHAPSGATLGGPQHE